MTRRERLERKMERREEWAGSRDRKATASFESARTAVAGIEPGQPILVGHHSEKRHRRALERHDSRMTAGVESMNMADHHRSRANGIAHQLDRSIFSDDDNAVESLLERVADLEAERDRIKAYNRSARAAGKKGENHGDLSLLSEDQKADLLSTMRHCPYHQKPGLPFPSYALSNLSGNIKRNKDRIESIRRDQATSESAEQAEGGILIVGAEWVSITFAEKPERETLTELKAAGFRWSRPSWHGKREDIPESLTEMAVLATH